MASKSKLKIFGRIGGNKKNKGLEVVSVSPQSHIIDQIEISDDYCLPPDCDDDDLYSEPIDSLNVHLDVSPTRSVSSQHSHTASDHIDINEVVLNTREHSAGFDNSSVNTSTSSSSSVGVGGRSSPLISKVNRPIDNTKDINGKSPTEAMISSALLHQLESSRISETPEVTNVDCVSTSPSTDLDALHGIYVNESQLKLEEIKKNRQNRPVSTISQPITPSDDPRNDLTGDEYDCPWDLKDTETEVYELVKQVKQKQSVSSSTSLQSKSPNSPPQPAVKPTPKRSPTSSVSSNGQPANNHFERDNNNRPRMSLNKRLNSSGSMSSAVLVEGEWREAKAPLAPVLVSPSSPELSSPPTIVSSHSPSAISRTSPTGSTNAASNVIYDQNSDSEIPARLRVSEEKQKAPFAQPRGSVSSLHSLKSQDSFYQNFNEAKKNPEQDKTDDFYDDPWNVDRVQQDIMDKINQQQSRQNTTERRSSDNISSTSRSHATRQDPQTSNCRSDRMVSTSSLVSEKVRVDKLSPRAVSGNVIHKPGSAAAPPLPKNGPGQAHANKLASSKPVLVVQRTTALPSTHEHKLSTTGSRSSMRKNSSSSDVPECQHRLGLGVNRSIPLSQQSWYHGSIQRNYAEELLRRQPDGSFLVRDTTGSLRDKTLSLKNSSGFIHIKIVQQTDGTFILGQFSHPFKSIMEMVEYYSRHKVNIKGAEHTYLEIPVMRES